MPAATEKFTGDLRSLIRDVPDFPKQGILFRDVTPLLQHGPAFPPLRGASVRGDREGAASRDRRHRVARLHLRRRRGHHAGVGFVPIRKPGKLPWKTRQQRYQLEYGSDGVEVHEDAVAAGARVALVDDLLATGGTAAAACRLLQDLGGQVVLASFCHRTGGLERPGAAWQGAGRSADRLSLIQRDSHRRPRTQR